MPIFQSGGGQVGSSQITDDSIVNADINSAAQIAMSKIAATAALSDGGQLAPAIQFQRVTVSSAALLDSNANPVPLLAAPGAGKMILLEGVGFNIDFNSVAYSGAGNYQIVYTGQTTALNATVSIATQINATADSYAYSQPAAMQDADIATGGPTNTGLSLRTTTAPTLGNSPLYVDLWYRIIPVST
jgi:hypothetical protein